MTRVIIIGAGLAGAAAAWRLAEAGHEVVVLERTVPANHLGSSHGSARIFRYAYPSVAYARLVIESARGWNELASTYGSPLIAPSGALDFGRTREPERLAAVLAELGVEHELLLQKDAIERWGIPFDTDVLWHPAAGVIDAERAVEAMLEAAERVGAVVMHDWPVQRVERTPVGYRVHAAHGESQEGKQVVVAAGGWLPDLLKELSLPQGFLAAFPPLDVRQEQAYHFPYRDGERGRDGTNLWPTFIYKSPAIQVYGLPGGRDADWRGQKIAEYNGGKRLVSAAHQDGVLDDANRRRVMDYVAEYLPQLEPEPYAETTCLFTNTPSEDFVIDRADGITVLAPCSGHGAKFAPLIGEYARALVEDDARAVPELFRPSVVAAR